MKSKKVTSSCSQSDILRSLWKYLCPVNNRKNTWVNSDKLLLCTTDKRKIVLSFKNYSVAKFYIFFKFGNYFGVLVQGATFSIL